MAPLDPLNPALDDNIRRTCRRIQFDKTVPVLFKLTVTVTEMAK